METCVHELLLNHTGLAKAVQLVLDNSPKIKIPNMVEVKGGQEEVDELLTMEPYNQCTIKEEGDYIDLLSVVILFVNGTSENVRQEVIYIDEITPSRILIDGHSVEDTITNSSLTPALALVTTETYIAELDDDDAEHELERTFDFHIVKFG